MAKITSPKFSPTFGLLVAGPGFSESHDPSIDAKIESLVKTIVSTLNKETASASQIYGSNADQRLILNVLTGNLDKPTGFWAEKIAESLGCMPQVVVCGGNQSVNLDQIPTKRIALGVLVEDDDYLFQEKLIQADTLRTFSDFLLWMGDTPDTPLNNRALRLLRATILEGKPVVWIQENGLVKMLDHLLIDEPHRLLLATSEDTQNPINSLFIPFDEARFQDELGFIANPLKSHSLKENHDQALTVLQRYLSEKAPCSFSERIAGKFDRFMSALVRMGGFAKALDFKLNEPWYGVDAKAEDSVATGKHIDEPLGLKESFSWSDRQANIAAGFHRDVIWLLYLLSTLAVFSAIAGAIDFGSLPEWFWAVTELVAIVGILISYGLASKLDLHGNWLFHRFIAEQIRYTRLGFPLLTFQEPLLAPLRSAEIKKTDKPAVTRLMSAETWLFKRTIVAAGLPHLATQSVYQPDLINESLKQYVVRIIEDQMDYHHKTHHAIHTVEHRLHFLTKLAFILTGLAVVGHFIVHAQWLLIFTGALPALAASIHGIVTMNEMGRVCQLSNHTYHQLGQLLKCIEKLDSQHMDNAKYFVHLRNITHQAATAMSDVNRQWQDLIQHQQTTLPA